MIPLMKHCREILTRLLIGPKMAKWSFTLTNARSDYFIVDLSTRQFRGIRMWKRFGRIRIIRPQMEHIACINIASKANKVLVMLVKNLTRRDVDLWKQLDIALLGLISNSHLRFGNLIVKEIRFKNALPKCPLE